MTFTTHILIAGALTKPIVHAHPVLSFGVAIASHYLTDLIPHWDYGIRSIDKKTQENVDAIQWDFRDKKFWRDFSHFTFDALLGLGILTLISWPTSLTQFSALFFVSAGAVLPDFLQGIYFTRKANFLKPAQRLHDFFHTRLRLSPYPLIGVPFQLVFAAISLWVLA